MNNEFPTIAAPAPSVRRQVRPQAARKRPSRTAVSVAEAFPWIPDLGDGTYRNPVICADYSDPDVVRVNDDFYMVASSFNCTPGLPILHSHDLVNWTLINHAVKNLPGERYREVRPGCGIWAPAIRYHDGRFWIFFPMPDEGIFVTTADDPAGQWSEPHCLVEGKGLIDPCPLWDDDGQAYLVHAYARSRSSIKHRLQVRPMAPDGSRLLGDGAIIADGEDRYPTIEGPKFLKRDGWYYVLAPAGGVETGWQLALRSRNVYGPYEDRRVLEQGSTSVNGPHQGALVDSPAGDWWFVHFQDAGAYGRILHLQPASWRNGWPEMGLDRDGNGTGEPVDIYPMLACQPEGGMPAIPAASDTFDSPRLGLQWQWYANHEDTWYSLSARPGQLRLYTQPGPADLGLTPHLLLQKLPARAFSCETSLDFMAGAQGERAGLAVVGLRHAALAIEPTGTGNRLVLRFDNIAVATTDAQVASLHLKVVVRDGGRCQFAWRTLTSPQGWTKIGEEFVASKGQWIGAKVGIFASRTPDAGSNGSYADFGFVRFCPPPPTGDIVRHKKELA